MELKGSADGRKGARDRQRQRKGETEHLSVTWVPTFILRSEGAEEQDARRSSMRFFYKWAPGVPESWRNRGQGWEVTWPNVSSEFCQNEDEEGVLQAPVWRSAVGLGAGRSGSARPGVRLSSLHRASLRAAFWGQRAAASYHPRGMLPLGIRAWWEGFQDPRPGSQTPSTHPLPLFWEPGCPAQWASLTCPAHLRRSSIKRDEEERSTCRLPTAQ